MENILGRQVGKEGQVRYGRSTGVVYLGRESVTSNGRRKVG
jgi:hypothetical protein